MLVLVAHPDLEHSHANRAMADAVRELPFAEVVNLYEEALDPERYRVAVGEASALVFQFPLWWASAPYMLKRWCDEVFMEIYEGGTVAGKPLLVAVTAAAPYESYRSGGEHRFTMDELLRPYQFLAEYSGMKWRTPFVVYGVGMPGTEADAEAGAQRYRSAVEMLLG